MERTPLAPSTPTTTGSPEHFWRLQSFTRTAGLIIGYLLRTIGALVFILPFYWMLTTSVKDVREAYRSPPTFYPQAITLAPYKTAWEFTPWLSHLQNTMVIMVTVLIGTLLSSTLCAYGFSRIRFKGRDVLFMCILASMMLPSQVTLIPTYLVFRYLGWLDSLKPLIIPSFFGGGAFNIFLMRQFFSTIPMDLEDAARIDGCSRLMVWWRIMLPLAMPAVTTISVFTIQASWNDFFGPLIYLNKPEKFTLALALASFQSQASYVSEIATGQIGLYTALMAAATMSTIPIIVLFVLAQRYFVEGIQLTGIKA